MQASSKLSLLKTALHVKWTRGITPLSSLGWFQGGWFRGRRAPTCNDMTVQQVNHTWLCPFWLHWKVKRNCMSLNFNERHLKHSLFTSNLSWSKSMQSVSFCCSYDCWWFLMPRLTDLCVQVLSYSFVSMEIQKNIRHQTRAFHLLANFPMPVHL